MTDTEAASTFPVREIVEDGWIWWMPCRICGREYTGRGRRVTTASEDRFEPIDRLVCEH